MTKDERRDHSFDDLPVKKLDFQQEMSQFKVVKKDHSKSDLTVMKSFNTTMWQVKSELRFKNDLVSKLLLKDKQPHNEAPSVERFLMRQDHHLIKQRANWNLMWEEQEWEHKRCCSFSPEVSISKRSFTSQYPALIGAYSTKNRTNFDTFINHQNYKSR